MFIQTLIVKIQNGSKQVCIRTIYDTGSMKSYMSEDIAKNMNFKCMGESKIKQSLFGGIETPGKVYKNNLIDLSDIFGKYECKKFLVRNTYVLKLNKFNMVHMFIQFVTCII